VFENRVLRTIFGPKRDEVIGEWKKGIMRSFVTCFFAKYDSNDVKEDGMGRACSTNGAKMNAYGVKR
jgi:hypothetical protein